MLIQSGWSEMKCERPQPPNVFTMGPAPHDWLMQRTEGVVHHGGAGTTAAGLRCGNPTFICPFFGDQHFWGAMVERAGVGPAPCLIGDLTAPVLKEKFATLRDPNILRNASRLAEAFAKEDGVRDGVACFYKHLPRSRMACAVCRARGVNPPGLARWYAKVPLCGRCHAVASAEAGKGTFVEARFRKWGQVGPSNAGSGLVGGVTYFTAETVGGIMDVFTEPVKGFNEEGWAGALTGAGKGIGKAIWRPCVGAGVMLDKWATGVANSFAAPENQRKDFATSAVRGLVAGDARAKLLGAPASEGAAGCSADERAQILQHFLQVNRGPKESSK